MPPTLFSQSDGAQTCELRHRVEGHLAIIYPDADHAARAADRLRQLARRLIQLLQVARRLLNFVTVVETALVHRLSKTPTLRPQTKSAQRQSGFR